MEAAGIAVFNTVAASDEELVAWARDGDDAAFEELFRRYRPRVAAFVNGIVHDEGRAEDVTQEAFLSALRRLRESDREIVFKPWIFQIARNASIDLYRRGTRTKEVSIDLDGGLPGAETERLAGHTGPDSSLIDKERFDQLRGALAELSESHHRIIVLRELEGLSYREIAERMELSPAAVESTLFRARRKLQHEYVQIDTGRRCQSIAALIGRLAEGLESGRDRRRLDRHARRCPACRRRARELGVEPVLAPRRPVSRIAAMLPLPAVLNRREVLDLHGYGVAAGVQKAAPLQGLAGAALEPGATAGKAVAVVAAAALLGGGATLDSVGPLAESPKDPPAIVQPDTRAPTAAREPTTLLLDQGLGRPLPAPVARKPQRRAAEGPSAPEPRPAGPTEVGTGAPAAPTDSMPRAVPKARAPADGGAAPPSPRGQIPQQSPRDGAGAVGKVAKPLAKALKALDVKAVLGHTGTTVRGLLVPPS